MMKRIKLSPTSPPENQLEAQVFEAIGHELDKLIDQIRGEGSHRHWQFLMRKLVREGRKSLRWLIDLTHDQEAALDADTALRDMAEEMKERLEPLPELLQFYLVCFSKPARGRGRRAGDDFLRDQCIAVLVAIAWERWGTFFLLTRHPGTSGPSLCSIIARVCRSRGIRIDEKRVKQIYDRFAGYLPIHQGWLAIKANSAI